MLSFAHYPTSLLAIPAALLLDRLLGEPRRWHPLVGFGRLADWLERHANRPGLPRLRGAGCWLLAVLPPTLLAAWLSHVLPTTAAWLFEVLLLYLALGARSLTEHAEAVRLPLQHGDLAQARGRVGCMVSRDTAQLDEVAVTRATVESVLENGNDAVFGAMFWFAVLGAPGAVLFRLANTLDAMWGYRTARFAHFGWAAARLDDALNYLPARLTALTYCLLGNLRRGLACWRAQAPLWYSPNAGPVMAAGAGALQLALGGPAPYHGRLKQRPGLGEGRAPLPADITRAVALVNRGAWLWAALCVAGGYALA